MILLALAVMSASAPTSVCQGEQVAIAPLTPFGVSATQARQAEEKVRSALASLPGTCIISRQRTVEEFRNQAPCEDASCKRSLARRLGAHLLVEGTAYGLGGRTQLLLTASRPESGSATQVAFELESAGADARRLLLASPAPKSKSRSPAKLAAGIGLGTASVAALTGGIVFGFSSASTAQQLKSSSVCSGADPYSQCMSGLIAQGRRQAQTANWLYGAAGLLALSAGMTFTWEWP